MIHKQFDNQIFKTLSDLVCNMSFFKLTKLNNTGISYPSEGSFCMLNSSGNLDNDVYFYCDSLIENLGKDYNVVCNLAAYYPPGSYIGWHTDSDFNVYNLICTYSDLGDSYFEYVLDNKPVRLKDPIGWSYKKSKWGNILHRAKSNCNRITLSFCSENESDIDNLINNLEEK